MSCRISIVCLGIGQRLGRFSTKCKLAIGKLPYYGKLRKHHNKTDKIKVF